MQFLMLLGQIFYVSAKSLWQKSLRLIRSIKRNPLEQYRIVLKQKKLLRENYRSDTKKVIIFVNTSDDKVNGGILSICAHYEESAKFKHIHGAEVILTTAPDRKLLLKYTRFKNYNHIFGFSEVLSFFDSLESIMIHVPEYMANRFLRDISNEDTGILKNIKNVHFNIMLQNMDGLNFLSTIESLEKLGKVTCTTAHEKYTTPELRQELGVPVHLLSVRGDPKGLNKRTYIEKQDLIIVSPDEHPLKSRVLKKIGDQFPLLKVQIISNITYEEYKRVIEKAKWALTFGEGLDGYFVETIFSGGISFSVFNAEYFTEEFRKLRTVYDSYDSLIGKICSDIKDLDEKINYQKYQDDQYSLCSKYYSPGKYHENLELFYKELYTFK